MRMYLGMIRGWGWGNGSKRGGGVVPMIRDSIIITLKENIFEGSENEGTWKNIEIRTGQSF